MPQVVPGRKKRQRLASEPPKPRRGGLGRETAGEAALPGTPEDTPKFPGCGTCLPHCWDPQRAREGSHSGLISPVSIPSLGKTCQWRKARWGGAGHGQSLLWARCWVVPKSKKLRTRRGQRGEERGFSGSFAPQSARQSFLASRVSDCTSSLFVWDREGPLGPGRHRHMSHQVWNWGSLPGSGEASNLESVALEGDIV